MCDLAYPKGAEQYILTRTDLFLGPKISIPSFSLMVTEDRASILFASIQ
jgi:hypothetical protein